MNTHQSPYKRVIFVCCNSREQGICCSPSGTLEGEQIRGWLKEYVKSKGLKGKIRVAKSGCMDLCSHGPNVMIFPDNIWLKGVKKEDLAQITEQYIDSILE